MKAPPDQAMQPTAGRRLNTVTSSRRISSVPPTVPSLAARASFFQRL
jgi:hypothetical protein